MTKLDKAAAECRAAWKAAPQATWAWCPHPAVRVEPLTEPFENRIEYILVEKPENERVARLNNFRPVLSKLPRKFLKAWADYDKAQADYDKAWADYYKAWADYYKAWADYCKAGANLNKAWADYLKAKADYRKAKADYRKAQVDYALTPECAAAHLADVPNHTWNGKGIF